MKMPQILQIEATSTGKMKKYPEKSNTHPQPLTEHSLDALSIDSLTPQTSISPNKSMPEPDFEMFTGRNSGRESTARLATRTTEAKEELG
jgi:hypothetical protein